MAAALPAGVISSVVAYRRERSFARFKQARLPGGGILLCRQKDAKAVQGCALKTRSPCCAGYEFEFFSIEKSKSVLHADGLKRCL